MDSAEFVSEQVAQEFADYPNLAKVHRPRKLQQSRRKRSSLTKSSSSAKACKVSADARVKTLGHPFVVRAGGLFCLACMIALSTKMSIVKCHQQSARHRDGLAKLDTDKANDDLIQQQMTDYYVTNPDATGCRLDHNTRIWRYKVVKSLLGSGTPLDRIQYLRPVLDAGGSITSKMEGFIAHILRNEQQQLRLDMDSMGGLFSLIFDGTTRLGEALNFIVRGCTADFRLLHRLTKFLTLESSLPGEDLATVLCHHLMRDLSATPQMLTALVRDSCPVNGVACRRVCSIFHATTDILCICHIVNCAGSRFQFRVLNTFISAYITLIGSSFAALHLFTTLLPTGETAKRHSNVRWFTTAEIMMQFAHNFDVIPSFIDALRENDIGGATTETLAETFRQHAEQLHAELFIVLDIAPYFVRVCYNMEGDRLETLLLYDAVEAVLAVGQSLGNDGITPHLDKFIRKNTPITVGSKVKKHYDGHGLCSGKVIRREQVVSTLYPGQEVDGFVVRFDVDRSTEDFEEEELRAILDVTANELRRDAIDCVRPAFQYLRDRVSGNTRTVLDFSSMYRFFRAARMFDPARAVDLNVTAAHVDDLVGSLPILTSRTAAMKQALPIYLRLAADFETDRTDIGQYTVDVLRFFRQHRAELGNDFCESARAVFSVPASSAACERVFSLLAALYPETRSRSLADQLEVSLMLRYNKRL